MVMNLMASITPSLMPKPLRGFEGLIRRQGSDPLCEPLWILESDLNRAKWIRITGLLP